MLDYNYLKDCFIKWEVIPIYLLFEHVIIFILILILIIIISSSIVDVIN